jgi:type II secretory pathway predicted ATPase ExeA
VVRQACERAARDVERALGRGGRLVALVGPEGVGKSVVLGLLAERSQGRLRPLLVPYPALQAAELCAWALGLLEEPTGGDPEAALARVALRAPGGRPLALLLDAAEALPEATAHRLARLLEEARGGLRLVVALRSGARADRVLAALGAGLVAVPLEEALSLRETRALLIAQLERCAVPAGIRARLLLADAIERLHEAAGGNPGRLAALVEEALHAGVLPDALPRPPESFPRPPEPGGRGAVPDSAASPSRDPTTPRAAPAAIEGYVPRAATERVLAHLGSDLRRGTREVLLTGPPGIGKTRVLRALARRLGSEFTAVLVPYPNLDAGGIARLALVLSAAPGAGESEGALLALAAERARAGRPLLLLVDEAGLVPQAARERLRAWAHAAAGPFVVWCTADDGRGRALELELGAGVPRHALDEPLSESETADLLRAGLAESDAGPHRLDRAALAAVHAEARGIPAVALRAVEHRLRGSTAQSEEAAPAAAATVLARARTPGALGDARLRRVNARALALGVALVFALTVALAFVASERRPASRVAPAAAPPPATTPPVPVPAPSGTAPPVSVHINAVPWARISVDGRELGVTPLGNVPLEPGMHRFRAVWPDGRSLERDVHVDEANRRVVLGSGGS